VGAKRGHRWTSRYEGATRMNLTIVIRIIRMLRSLPSVHPVPSPPLSDLPLRFASSSMSVPLASSTTAHSTVTLSRTNSASSPSPWSSAPFPLTQGLIDTRIIKIRPLIPPSCLLEELPTPLDTQQHIIDARKTASDIINGRDDRIMVVIGPCSIHDPTSAIEYATKLKPLADQYKHELFVVMRAYLEKPRTTVGWKGLVNDPNLDGSFCINTGLRVSRKLLLDLNGLGLPLAMEMLDTITPQFLADLISWGAIGARTTESQLHRELVSGLSMPIGFKNGTGGNCKIATDAIVASRSPHSFLSVTNQGLAAIVQTSGNPDCHLVLRGADTGPNYERKYVDDAVKALASVNAPLAVMIDCSHGNSNKDHRNQMKVVRSIAEQCAQSDHTTSQHIVGVMIESNLVEGAQKLQCGVGQKEKLTYGQSVTDACIAWSDTERALAELAEGVRARRKIHGKSPADTTPKESPTGEQPVRW
jgi:3-deoxy-7-phosphoheptulonate synthase